MGEYRRLALLHHPDKPTGDKETFQRLQNAYEAVVEVLLQEGGLKQGLRCNKAEAGEGGTRQTRSGTKENNMEQAAGTEDRQELSEVERHARRQNALEAALR